MVRWQGPGLHMNGGHISDYPSDGHFPDNAIGVLLRGFEKLAARLLAIYLNRTVK